MAEIIERISKLLRGDNNSNYISSHVNQLLKTLGLKDTPEEIEKEIKNLEKQWMELALLREELENEKKKISLEESTNQPPNTEVKNLENEIADIDHNIRDVTLRLEILYMVQRLKELEKLNELLKQIHKSKVWKEAFKLVKKRNSTKSKETSSTEISDNHHKEIEILLKKVSLKEIREEMDNLKRLYMENESRKKELEKQVEELFKEVEGKPDSFKYFVATKITNIKERIADVNDYLNRINLMYCILHKLQKYKEKMEALRYNDKEKLSYETEERILKNCQTIINDIVENDEKIDICGFGRELFEVYQEEGKGEEYSS